MWTAPEAPMWTAAAHLPPGASRSPTATSPAAPPGWRSPSGWRASTTGSTPYGRARRPCCRTSMRRETALAVISPNTRLGSPGCQGDRGRARRAARRGGHDQVGAAHRDLDRQGHPVAVLDRRRPDRLALPGSRPAPPQHRGHLGRGGTELVSAEDVQVVAHVDLQHLAAQPDLLRTSTWMSSIASHGTCRWPAKPCTTVRPLSSAASRTGTRTSRNPMAPTSRAAGTASTTPRTSPCAYQNRARPAHATAPRILKTASSRRTFHMATESIQVAVIRCDRAVCNHSTSPGKPAP